MLQSEMGLRIRPIQTRGPSRTLRVVSHRPEIRRQQPSQSLYLCLLKGKEKTKRQDQVRPSAAAKTDEEKNKDNMIVASNWDCFCLEFHTVT
ncbi:hypothetical protein V6N13_099440 [Hibiscus sabdariffa]